MAAPDLDIDLLRSFVAVAEAGSFTAAADVIGRTQSAVSQKILRLEEALGCRVFERSSRSLSLTREGERLMAPARRMLELNDETIRRFVEPPVAGKLRLGIADDGSPPPAWRSTPTSRCRWFCCRSPAPIAASC
jgi:DNA-binding transcriptional LysR family regulator